MNQDKAREIIGLLNSNFRAIRRETEEIEHSTRPRENSREEIENNINRIKELENESIRITKATYKDEEIFIDEIYNFLNLYKNNVPDRPKVIPKFLSDYVTGDIDSAYNKMNELFETYTSGISNRLDRLNRYKDL